LKTHAYVVAPAPPSLLVPLLTGIAASR
jgi:hypothetical protein